MAERSQNGDRFKLWESQGLNEDMMISPKLPECSNRFSVELPERGVGLVESVAGDLTVRQTVAALGRALRQLE